MQDSCVHSPNCLAAVMAVLLVTPAWAAGARPATMPTRDVDITYAMAAPGPDGKIAELSQRLRWDTEAGEMRVDTPNPGVYTIMNYRDHKLLVVRDADRSMIVMHAGNVDAAPGVGHDAQFTRLDQDTVAGLPCTDWQTHDASGHDAVVCLTDDGVLLRAKSGQTVLVQATHVAYGPQPANLFVPPAGYQAVTPPQ